MTDSQSPKAPNPATSRFPPRFRCNVQIVIEWGTATLDGAVSDISASGMFVQLDSPLWVGARFTGRLKMDDPLAVHCDVRRVEPGRGMGVTFQAAEENGRMAIATLLKQLAG